MHIIDETMGLFKKFFGKSKKVHAAYKEKTVKILVMGKQGVGKTNIIKKLCNHQDCQQDDAFEHYTPTLYEVYDKNVIVDEYNVHMQFMDLGGSHNFPSMQEVFIKQADIYILVYSIDDVESYNQIIQLREQILNVKNKRTTDLPFIVIRSKMDLKQKRTKKEQSRRKSVNHWCSLTYDVSSKSGLRINAIMDSLIEESKFIGNEKDLGDGKISGRYVYNEDGTEESELYIRAPTLFHTPDNSDAKVEKRRRKSLQHHAKKKNVQRSNSFSPFSSFRRRKLRKEENVHSQGSVEIPSAGFEIPNHLLEQKSKMISSATAETNSNRTPPVTTVLAASKFKRRIFRNSGRRSFEEPESSSESFLSQKMRIRKKSLSSNDLLNFEESSNRTPKLGQRGRSSSDADERKLEPSKKLDLMRQRSISVGSREACRKTKPTKFDIVHTTLTLNKDKQSQEDLGTPKILPRRFLRTHSEYNAETRRNNFQKARKLSASVDVLSDSNESLPETANFKMSYNTRRKSRSQNDLAASVMQFNRNMNKSISVEDTSRKIFDSPKLILSAMGKKKTSNATEVKSILKTPPIDNDDTMSIKSFMEGTNKKKRSVSFGKGDKQRPRISVSSLRKKISIQSNVSTTSSDMNESSDAASDVNLGGSLPRRRRRSLSSNDLTLITEQSFASTEELSNSPGEDSMLFQKTSPQKKRSLIRSKSITESEREPADSPIFRATQWFQSNSTLGN